MPTKTSRRDVVGALAVTSDPVFAALAAYENAKEGYALAEKEWNAAENKYFDRIPDAIPLYIHTLNMNFNSFHQLEEYLTPMHWKNVLEIVEAHEKLKDRYMQSVSIRRKYQVDEKEEAFNAACHRQSRAAVAVLSATPQTIEGALALLDFTASEDAFELQGSKYFPDGEFLQDAISRATNLIREKTGLPSRRAA